VNIRSLQRLSQAQVEITKTDGIGESDEMTRRKVPRPRRNRGASEETEGPSDPDEAMRALTELFSEPELRRSAHFRYPVDGRLNDFDRAIYDAVDKQFGPNTKRERWVQRLRRLGLVSDRKEGD
jgi:hypothetical protein